MEGVGGDGTCEFPSMMMMVNNASNGTGTSSSNRRIFLSSSGDGDGDGGHASMVKQLYGQNPNLCFKESNNNNTSVDHVSGNSIHGEFMKAKIMAHPHFPRLLAAYVNCQKVGAPPEVVAKLDEACAASGAGVSHNRSSSSSSSSFGEDPALDQFMEAYCEMLLKYEQELTKPFKETMLFLTRIEYQFKALTLAPDHHSGYGDFPGRNGSSKEDIEGREAHIDPQAEVKELKDQLFRRYSGYLGNLKQEFLKKRKKGKLPKEARQQLVEWWTRHYKWPYPSESQKVALAESTGLDQKQINNWFINQRKRHWKPSEEMQFVVMDGAYPHYCFENVAGNPLQMDFAPAHL